MRNFRYRLAPVQRLKNYQIEQKEQEIAELESQIQQKLREIEEGRQAVQDMRQQLLETQANIVQAEQRMDLFRSYMQRVEAQKRSEIRSLREKQEQKRKELLKLYQEQKILERYREKKEADWNREMRKEESAQMDEIGTQNYVRRERERGGVLVYLLAPILLAGVAAAVGFYTGYLDKNMLEKIPILGERLRSATETVQVVSATEEEEYLTVGDIIGDLDQPMPEMMRNISAKLEQIQQRHAELDEWERQLNRRAELMREQEQQIAQIARDVTQSIQTLQDLRKQREEKLQSEMSERETQLAAMIQGNKPKDIAPTISAMFQVQPVDDPEEARERQLIILRIMHRMTDKNRAELFGEIAETNPQVAADMIVEYNNTSMDELYNIEVADNTNNQPTNGGTQALPNSIIPNQEGQGQNQNPQGQAQGQQGPLQGQAATDQPDLDAPQLVGENGNAAAAGG